LAVVLGETEAEIIEGGVEMTCRRWDCPEEAV